MRNATRFMLLGAATGLLAPAGLALYAVAAGATPDPGLLVAFLAAGGALALGAAGRMIGRRDDELEARNRALEALSQRLHALSVTDPLTGIANRRTFDERLALEVAVATRYRTPLALVMIDLDRFKRTNDRFGHRVGDEVLRAVGALLARECRAGDLVARYGGEEFVAVLPHTDAIAAARWAERVRAAIAGTPVPSEVGPIRVTASFGVAAVGPQTGEPGALVAAADAALYRAKQAGRDRVVAHDPGAPVLTVPRGPSSPLPRRAEDDGETSTSPEVVRGVRRATSC